MNDKRKAVLDMLDRHGIEYDLVEHPAVYTMEEMEALELRGIEFVVKNLFLRDDKKKRFFLVSLTMGKTANVKELQEKLGSRRLSFASGDLLESVLGLKQGEVTPFGVLNDCGHIAEVVFDSGIRAFERVGVHPNDNSATVFLAPSDLERVIREQGNPFRYLEL